MQPEFSFLFKKNESIGEDTPNTNWLNPITIRDKIRLEFKNNNRIYPIQQALGKFAPVAPHIVINPNYNPNINFENQIVNWWEEK